jgi:acyl carrier protein
MQMQFDIAGTTHRHDTQSRVIATIESLVQDWELDRPVHSGTRLVADLGFESIDLIQMVAALEQEFGNRNFSFAELLIVDGRYVDDLTVAQITGALVDRV